LKEEALDRTMWRNRFGGGFGPVVRQNTEWMNERRCDRFVYTGLSNEFLCFEGLRSDMRRETN